MSDLPNDPDSGFGQGFGEGAQPGAEPEAPADIHAGAPAPEPESEPDVELTVEDLVENLEKVTAERDDYLDALRRLQAEFENYRKAVAKREVDAKARANDGLVSELLPVLDACDGAIANGNEHVLPVQTALLEALTKQGLERLEPAGEPFDPAQHDAVMHEDGEEENGPVVAEVLRVGYGWKGRVVRPVMVKTRG